MKFLTMIFLCAKCTTLRTLSTDSCVKSTMHEGYNLLFIATIAALQNTNPINSIE